jgi:starch-binding outer membrane protein, SusD/RagB family
MRVSIAVVAAAMLVAACEPDLNVPNLNNPNAGGDATRSTVLTGAQGLIGLIRGDATAAVRTIGIWGREAYDLRPEEPRPYTDNLIGPRDPNSFGSGLYFNYGTLVNVRTVLNAADAVGNMTDAEREGVRGWAKTVAAYDYFLLALGYPESGAPLEPPEDPNGELSDVVAAQALYERSFQLFDEAYQHLQSAGSSFAFQLIPGFDGFDTPATFAQANRALKARALKYAGRWQDALNALDQSFVDANAPLDEGIYFDYFAADNVFNPFFGGTTDYLHPRFLANAQTQPGGAKDQRAIDKANPIAPVTEQGVTVTERPAIYDSSTDPFPWITNEELLLLRAEANFNLGNTAAAIADVNVVREEAGGLAPVSGLSGDALLEEILYNKFYSLIWQGGWTYWDAYQYDRLDVLPRSLPEHVVFDQINWPAAECLARDLTTGACGSVTGF